MDMDQQHEIQLSASRLEELIADLEDHSDQLERESDLWGITLAMVGYGRWKLDMAAQALELDEMAASFLGYSDAITLSVSNFLACIHFEDKGGAQSEFEQALRERRKADIEFRISSTTGDTRWLRAKGFRPNNSAPLVYGVVEDITEHKLTQQERARLLQETLLANQDKDLFIEAATHELRTPINSVMGYLSLLKDGIYGKLRLTKQQWKIFDRAIDMVDKQIGHVTQILRFNELRSGKVELELYDFNFPTNFLIERFSDQATAKQIKLDFNIEPNLRIHASDEGVNQIMMRLIDNALKFTSAGGQITVTSQRIGTTVAIAVKDTGIGIPERELDRIFERYTQVNSQHPYSGYGLGLAMSKLYTEHMDSTLSVESRVGIGSTFTLTLPCAL